MRALVVYESMYGNTRTIAQRIAEGLSSHLAVDIVEVGVAPQQLGEDIGLVVAGGPTHAFGMSRPGTREKAAATRPKDSLVSQGIGIREWLAALPRGQAGVAAAAFDTSINKPRLPGRASAAAAKHLRKLGFRQVVPAEAFFVIGGEGPLLDGEEERARRWGEALGSKVGGD